VSPHGIWKSNGYGWILKLDDTGYSLFDVTRSACVEFERGSADEFEAGFEILNKDYQSDLAVCIRNDITRYGFSRLAGFPVEPLHLHEERQPDPQKTLEFFCEVFEQDYAFFDLRGVDWNAACAGARAKIHAGSSPEELFDELHKLISPLYDNHVVLSDGNRTVGSERIGEIKALISAELGLRNSYIGHPYNIARIGAFINREFLGQGGETAGNGVFNWGMITPEVGYLNILKLYGVADTEAARNAADLPPRRADHAQFLRDDLDAIELIMNRIMVDLSHSSAIILDVRLNGGGFDNLGMAIAGRFTDKRHLAFTKQARHGHGVTPRQEFFVKPEGKMQFTRPVYVLTSVRTASAGDIFAMCMRNLPNVTLVGQPSTGILSDNLKKHLPNGWTTTISNEHYCSVDGKVFEGPGVPVDVETPVFVKNDFTAGFHKAVDKALELATSNQSSTPGL
jgi:hypothetical protein